MPLFLKHKRRQDKYTCVILGFVVVSNAIDSNQN